MEDKKQNRFSKWVLWFGGISAIIGVFILVSNLGENNSYSRYLPYGLLLLCPLSHLFMMNMHKGSHDHHQNDDKGKEDSKSCH